MMCRIRDSVPKHKLARSNHRRDNGGRLGLGKGISRKRSTFRKTAALAVQRQALLTLAPCSSMRALVKIVSRKLNVNGTLGNDT